MNKEQADLVVQRLKHLERSHRRLKLLTGCLLTTLGLVFLMGASAQKAGNVLEEVRARRFVLLDADGKARAEMAVEKEWSGLRLKDAGGKVRALLVTKPEGPILELRDETGEARTTLGVGRHGQSIIQQNIIRSLPRSRIQ